MAKSSSKITEVHQLKPFPLGRFCNKSKHHFTLQIIGNMLLPISENQFVLTIVVPVIIRSLYLIILLKVKEEKNISEISKFVFVICLFYRPKNMEDTT